MNRETQIAIGRRLLRYLKQPEESLAGPLSANDMAAYTSESQYSREKIVLFRDMPLVLGFSCQLREVGDFLTDQNTGVPILITRGQDRRVRAFLNICRHRGTLVAEKPSGNCLNFACPYHGWVYDTQGCLVSIPEGGYGFEGLNKERHGLIPLPAAERHGLIWVVPNPDGSLDLDSHLKELDPDLAGYGFEHYVHFQTNTFTRAMNWKLVMDGFWEAYHLKVLHKQTIESIFHPKTTTFDPLGWHLRMVIPRKSISTLEGLPESQWDIIPHTAIVYNLFPNAIFVMQGDHVEITRAFPGSKAGECVVHFSLFAPEQWKTEGARKHWQRNMDLLMATVEQEDFRVTQGIQRAAAAGYPRHVVIGGYEPSMAHFHRNIRRALGLPAEVAAELHVSAARPRARAG